MENYKEEIIATRTGSLGSSDGKLIRRVAETGEIPKASEYRLAVCKGLVPQKEIPRTAAVVAGDEMELMIFKFVSAGMPNDIICESNPLWRSRFYKYENVQLISHPDIVLRSDKELNIYEVKTTCHNVEQTKETYKEQLYIHYLLGLEEARKLGIKKENVHIYLIVYDTNGLDLKAENEFEPDRLFVIEIKPEPFDVIKGMKIIDNYLGNLTEYNPESEDEIPAELLPEEVKGEFELVSQALKEIKEREKFIEDFKVRLYDFMLEQKIKSVKNDEWSITRIDPSTAVSFDSKRFMDDYRAAHPRAAKKMQEKYKKEVSRKGCVQIKIK